MQHEFKVHKFCLEQPVSRRFSFRASKSKLAELVSVDIIDDRVTSSDNEVSPAFYLNKKFV